MTVSSDTLRLGIVEETTAGTTPTTPAYDLVRTTGEGLIYEVTTTTSDEMGGLNRGIKENILTGGNVTGEIQFELSKFDAFEKLISAGIGNDWGQDPAGNPVTDSDVVYDWSTRRTFTIEKRFTLDATPTYNYHRFLGCLVDTINLSIVPNEKITGSFGFIGNEMVTADAEVAGSTYASAGTNPIMTSPLVTGIELLSPPGVDNTTGAPLGTPVSWLNGSCFSSLDLTITNNARGIDCIGTLGNREVVLGRIEATSTGSLYYAADDPLDALVAQTEYALRVTMTDEDSNSYEVLYPRVAFSVANANATGTNTDVMAEFSLQMLEYQGDDYAYTVQITRA